MSFEKHSEKMGVTNCKHIKNVRNGRKNSLLTSILFLQEYGEMTEICNIEYISIHYKLPVVAEEVLEFIDVKYPEPEEECIDVDFEEVHVDCDHDEDNYCVNCAHIRDSKVDLVADQVINKNSWIISDTVFILFSRFIPQDMVSVMRIP